MKNKYILVVVLALVVIGTVIGAVVMHKDHQRSLLLLHSRPSF